MCQIVRLCGLGGRLSISCQLAHCQIFCALSFILFHSFFSSSSSSSTPYLSNPIQQEPREENGTGKKERRKPKHGLECTDIYYHINCAHITQLTLSEDVAWMKTKIYSMCDSLVRQDWWLPSVQSTATVVGEGPEWKHSLPFGLFCWKCKCFTRSLIVYSKE